VAPNVIQGKLRTILLTLIDLGIIFVNSS